MQEARDASRRAATERDAARARVGRVTGVVLAGSLAVAGSLAGYVSSATSGRKLARRVAKVRTVHPTPKTPSQVPVPAAPPPPRLIPSSSPPPPPAAPQAPAQAPAQAPVEAPPVVVSGGS